MTSSPRARSLARGASGVRQQRLHAKIEVTVKKMENKQFNDVNADQRRLQIEAALAEYPHLPSDALSDLINWFKREATAFEVGILASNSVIYDNYRRFRRDHIDRLTIPEITGVVGLATLIVAAAAAIAVAV